MTPFTLEITLRNFKIVWGQTSGGFYSPERERERERLQCLGQLSGKHEVVMFFFTGCHDQI